MGADSRGSKKRPVSLPQGAHEIHVCMHGISRLQSDHLPWVNGCHMLFHYSESENKRQNH